MNRFSLGLLAGAFLVSSVVMTGPVQADLIGDTVNFDRFFNGSPLGSVTDSGVVGAGVEFTDSGSTTIDISANSIRFEFGGIPGGISWGLGTPPQFYRIADLDWVGQSGSITGLDVNFGGTITQANDALNPFSASNATFGSDFIELEIGGYFFEDSFVQIDLITTHTPVPEPGTIFLFGTGLAGLAAWRYKKKTTSKF